MTAENPYEPPLQARLVEKPPKQKRKRTPEEMNLRDAIIAIVMGTFSLFLVFTGWQNGVLGDDRVFLWAAGVVMFFAVLYRLSRH